MKKIKSFHIKEQSGVAFNIKKNQIIRIIDPKGEQVSDLMTFSSDNQKEWLSSGRTIDYNGKIYLAEGDILYSNKSNPMLTIVKDTVKKHDFLLTPCSQEMFKKLYNFKGHHPSCFENLVVNLKKFGIRDYQIPTIFNIFMNVNVRTSGEIRIKPPLSKAGDFIDLKAEMDLIVGVTACSAELSNNGIFKPIDVEIYYLPEEQK